MYEQQEGWLICATKVNSLIFLCAFNTEEKKLALQRGKTPKEKLFEYWGRKFEQYLLTGNKLITLEKYVWKLRLKTLI